METLLSDGLTTGEELPEPDPVPVRFRMPFFTALRASARSLSPPTMLFLELIVSVLELPTRPCT